MYKISAMTLSLFPSHIQCKISIFLIDNEGGLVTVEAIFSFE